MKYKLPEKLALANIPTKIEKLKLSKEFEHIDIYIKRDDQTGFELSGNKVRKLEYLMHQLKEEKIDRVITCGAVQSNHVRATAACAAKLGIKCTAVLKGEKPEKKCNYYMTHCFGATVHLISEDDYKYKRNEIMALFQQEYEAEDEKVYVIPEGASNGLGNFGYFEAFEEILAQEESPYDIISVPVGSCGTYAGLYIANEYYQAKKHILGINIYDAKVDYTKKTKEVIALIKEHDPILDAISLSNIDIKNAYVGAGYGKTSPAIYAFMDEFAKREGILLDPVYTGKALYGLYSELKKLDKVVTSNYNVLFIHTGGTFVY